MRVAIVGGGLQGLEAVYLAHKAGWRTILIDKAPDPPASGLCGNFFQTDVTDPNEFNRLMERNGPVDLVIPALENKPALDALVRWSKTSPIPLAFDPVAYEVSSSKIRSDALFAQIPVPTPRPWPGCGFPLVAKPEGGSGSMGVRVFNDKEELHEAFGSALPPPGWVLQEFVSGPSYSLEVAGVPGDYQTGTVTGLEMDEAHDCRRVNAPTMLTREQTSQLETIAVKIAEAIALLGLMDVEVILHDKEFKVLEIDARLPSQTPTAVYHSSGINLLELLAGCFVDNFKPRRGWHPQPTETPGEGKQKVVVYEHIRVNEKGISYLGEHIMVGAGPLYWTENFFGADEAITNYRAGARDWVATLIIFASTWVELSYKRNRIINKLSNIGK